MIWLVHVDEAPNDLGPTGHLPKRLLCSFSRTERARFYAECCRSPFDGHDIVIAGNCPERPDAAVLQPIDGGVPTEESASSIEQFVVNVSVRGYYQQRSLM